MHIRFPDIAQELTKLAEADQVEIRAHYAKLDALKTTEEKASLDANLLATCHERAARMMTLLEIISEPRISNVGLRGSEAISLLALHSYLDEMKTVLAKYEAVYAKDPADIYAEAIPSLTDRIMVFEEQCQLYGNNWMIDAKGQFFLIPVKDFANMNERRARFGLGPRMRPIVYATGLEKYPLGKGAARPEDQRELTESEYQAFIKGHVR